MIIHKVLKQQKNVVLSASLSIANICLGVFPNITSWIIGSWLLGKLSCYVLGRMEFFFSIMRYTLILTITVDRFAVVIYPFQYPRTAQKLRRYLHRLVVCTAQSHVPGVRCKRRGLLKSWRDRSSMRSLRKMLRNVLLCLRHRASAHAIMTFGIVAPFILIVMFYKVKQLNTAVTCGTI